MGRYILKRFLLILPTLLGILLINFTIVQFAPGAPARHPKGSARCVSTQAIRQSLLKRYPVAFEIAFLGEF